jgi:hypothetical protein
MMHRVKDRFFLVLVLALLFCTFQIRVEFNTYFNIETNSSFRIYLRFQYSYHY